MFACQVRVVSTHKYPAIWVNTNPTCSLNELRFLNPNMTHLLNGLVISTCLSDFIQKKKIIINQIDMDYEKPNKYIFLIYNLELMNSCITNNHSKLKHILISQIINHNMSNKINNNNS